MRYIVILASILGLLAACEGTEGGGPYGDGPQLLAAEEAVELLADRDDVVVIDVRTPEEFEDGHLADAELIDIQASDFDERIAELDPDVTYVVYCRTGARSARAVQAMADIGIEELYDAGGFADLAAAGAPVADR
jgi:phage shock protein E